MLVLRRLMCLIVMILATNSTNSQDGFRIITENIILIAGGDSIAYYSQISQSGNYIVAQADTYQAGEYLTTNLHAWDITDIHNIRKTSAKNPIVFETKTLGIPAIGLRQVVISPDDRYVAIHTDRELQIYTLPNLTLYFALATEYYGYMAWSLDDQFIGILYNTRMLVINTKNGDQYQYTLDDYPISKLVPNDYGWILVDYKVDNGSDFISCAKLLDICHKYSLENNELYPVIAMNGDIAISQNNSNMQIWKLKSDNQFHQDRVLPQDNQICPESLTARYLYSNCHGNEKILDFITLMPVYSLVDYPIFTPVWLSDQYFLTSWFHEGVVWLHKIPSQQASIIFDVRNTELVNFENIINSNSLPGYDFTPLLVSSRQGNRVLLNVDFALFLFLFEIEPA